MPVKCCVLKSSNVPLFVEHNIYEFIYYISVSETGLENNSFQCSSRRAYEIYYTEKPFFFK